MKIYNTLTRRKEEFVPIEEGKVKMYVCGPTVYNFFHIGNARPFVVFDTMRKYLEYRGYKVKFVQNFTDVDDKIINRAKEEGISAGEVSEKYIEEYYKDAAALNVKKANVHPKVTDTMKDIIKFVEDLIEKGYAYESEGDVYYRARKFDGYGKLSGKNIDDLISGARIAVGEKKEDPLDFALWKARKEESEIAWESPWGMGRPGWHIECSAMSKKFLGTTIDIHAGGEDLQFPHHENEIAQTEALTGKRFSKYWMHNGLIKVNGQKMSKSLGNFILLSELLDNFSPDAVKFALLSTSYRNDVNITDNLFSDSEKHVYEFYKVIAEVEARFGVGGSYPKIDEEFNSAMDDDFNTALAISNLFGYFKAIKKALSGGDESAKDMVAQIKKTYSLLGLFKVDAKKFTESYESKNKSDIPSEILALLEEMQNARKEKNWAVSDKIRDEILQKGYLVKITKDGCEVTKK